jgi:hypothetical protein
MKLLKAIVVDNFDPAINQSFFVNIIGQSEVGDYVIERPEKVKFTSPFNSLNKGGMAGHVPGIGTMVIVCTLDNGPDDEYYYMGSLFEYFDKLSEGTVREGLSVNPTEFMMGPPNPFGLGAPGAEVMIQNNSECGLRLIDEKSKNINDARSELYTPSKRITLSDNPQVNSIVLDADEHSTQNMARIDLVGDDPANFSKGHHSFSVRTTGSQSFVSDEEVFICVREGSEINLINESTGFGVLDAGSKEWGNINLQSKYNGINLFTGAGFSFPDAPPPGVVPPVVDDSLIRIESLNPVATGGIVLRCRSATTTIEVNTLGQINIIGGAGINVHTLGTLNMFGGTGINLNSGGPININSASPVNMDGSFINLNSGLSTGATAAATLPVPQEPTAHPLGVLPFNYEV